MTASVSGSAENIYGFSGNAGMTNTTSQYGLGGAQYCSGSIMGLTQDDGDNAVDVAYSTKPDKWCATTLNAMSTSNK